jgi:hypothetical protein
MLTKLAAFVVVTLSVASAASAQEADLQHIMCKDFVSMPNKQKCIILIFLEGYNASRSEPPTIHFDKLVGQAKAVGAYCSNHKEESIVAAAESIMQGN